MLIWVVLIGVVAAIPDTHLQATGHGYNERDWLEGDSYDANRNTLAGQTAGLAASATDRYDDQNRLVQRTEGGVGGRTITVLYDADGNRVRKSVTIPGRGTVTTYYLVDTENPTGYAQVTALVPPDLRGELDRQPDVSGLSFLK